MFQTFVVFLLSSSSAQFLDIDKPLNFKTVVTGNSFKLSALNIYARNIVVVCPIIYISV